MATHRSSSLRLEMKRIISNLDERWQQAASREICQNLSKLLNEEIPQQVNHVLAWVAHFPGEIDLSSLINDHLDRFQIYLPRTLADNKMSFISIGKDWVNNMATGNYGIPEPELSSGITYDPTWASETVALVPGLAFDHLGNRLGRGGGYYDRFFSRKPQAEIAKVGVCWELQFIKQLPAQAHDVVMDWVCHERGVTRTSYANDDSFDE